MMAINACKDTRQPYRTAQTRLLFERQGIRLQVEVADTEKAWARGLMQREELAADAGMLFVFPDDAVRGVWMKNTLIPLDILFISATGEVVSWLQHVPPCVSDDCEAYYSSKPVRYMLEVNAGFIRRASIRRGDKIIVEPLHKE
ncbi:MAG: hypothetical protein CVV13_01455 [Gammaproteobacteria bacterium HGW-Gammaproteobacteria-3]|nr:MAG: hypothetical protein CVV13_01455 [Gammaproteobacteria bacterium HGW-Gammaproteobacteria-3]